MRVACADSSQVDQVADQAPPTLDLTFVQQTFKERKVSKRSMEVTVAYILPTSNECDRFPASKLVCSDLRKGMDSSTLEILMFSAVGQQPTVERVSM
ncbi:hypothetical protein PC129_g11427 [Phytophthora cactorum]|uniref:Uncharacterized protein n=1 Tax=Phytophthora cactorum TaxID=29920 RepID=A0A329SFK9_9STRA|nr:hypothetical protein Pcac1_g12293 [Phytophthora cactorum]KAG2801913.1 hypothetical protein PC112_g19842 [Phytophthora cactorum]KAG2802475.1 hypothetical protein PC111_g19086 [Phytophthora cactorum]KAG2838375.1 hypothetical protein PC113_g19672 [Phytophthora cactorum]KAG2881435.1 hypothetical protein PC114_g21554 [Phytophthora cactorum]